MGSRDAALIYFLLPNIIAFATAAITPVLIAIA